MNRKLLESYQANKRLIERNNKMIEEERCKEIKEVMGKVTGSSREFPYTERHFTVQMNEPVKNDKSAKRILRWQQEIEEAEKEATKVESFIEGIRDVRDREILTYRYIDNIKVGEIAKKVNYTHGRISQIISKYIKD